MTRKKSPLPPLRKKLIDVDYTLSPTTSTSQKAFNPCLISSEYQLEILVKNILDEVLPVKKPKRERTDKPSIKRQEYQEAITTFLLNCTHSFVFLRGNNALNLSDLREACNVDKKSRYPELRPFPRIITEAVDWLHERGMIAQVIGSCDKEIDHKQPKDSRWKIFNSDPTVIHPSKELIKFINLCKVSDDNELVRVNQKINGEKYLVDYEDTEKIDKMRENIVRFNFFRSKHVYKIGGKEFIPEPIYRVYRALKVNNGYADQSDDLIGGRFNGGIVQMSKNERNKITIDDEQTTIVDFNHIGISIAYKKVLKGPFTVDHTTSIMSTSATFDSRPYHLNYVYECYL